MKPIWTCFDSVSFSANICFFSCGVIIIKGVRPLATGHWLLASSQKQKASGQNVKNLCKRYV
jgi:hypothetical protein